MKKLVLFLMALFLLVGCQQPAKKDESKTADKPAEKTKDDSVQEHDVIIIGAGGAGLAASIAATEAGADAIILEKMPIAGGNTTRATGGMNAAETKFQEALGIKDSVDLFVKETMKGGYDKNNIELVKYMAQNSAPTIDWLDSLGIRLENVGFSGGFSVKRIHRPKDGSSVGNYLVSGLLKVIEQKGIKIEYNTKATELIVENGKVVGVKAEKDGKTITYKGKAVVIAAGGFAGNLDMVVKYQPDLKGFVTTNHAGATGDGIIMAEAIQANTVDLDQIQIHPTVEQKTSALITEALRGDGAILVNQDGKRFVNELLTRDKVSKAEIEQKGSYAYILFDDALRANNKVIDKYIAQGLTKQGNTLAELAKELEMDAKTLEATLKTYNDAVKAKKDNEFNRVAESLLPVEKGPFYAVKIAPGIHHTMGGIKINTLTQVINKDNKVIDALYAAGEVTGGVHGGNRIGGNAVTDIMVFGRQAGTQAGKYAMANGGKGASNKPVEVKEEVKAPTTPGKLKDGTYSEKVQGNNGPFTVEVVVENGNITKINFPGNTETSTIFSGVEKKIVKQIIETQKVDGIDVVAGATHSSQAVLEAVTKVMKENTK